MTKVSKNLQMKTIVPPKKDNSALVSRYTFDSFKLRFPLDEVTILNDQILANKIKIITDSDTGEILEEETIQSKSFKVQYEDYRIHIAVTNNFNNKELVILCNSKLLECDYLNGIDKNNIKKVYDKLMAANVVFISYDTFLRGSISDVDIKKDITIESPKKFDSYTLDMQRSTIAKKGRDKGVNRITQAYNKGIEWNKRENATPKSPFLKIYHKGLEIKTGKNRYFFARYISCEDTTNLCRIETTIKNRKHWRSYDLDIRTLRDMLSLNQATLGAIVKESINRNLNPRITTPKQSISHHTMTSKEVQIYAFLSYVTLNQNVERSEVISLYLSYFSDKQRRYRMKKECEVVYDKFIEGNKYQEESKRGAAFFNSLGWG